MMGPILEAGLSLEGQLGPGTDLWRSIRFGASLSPGPMIAVRRQTPVTPSDGLRGVANGSTPVRWA
jgi:hypothetical protein